MKKQFQVCLIDKEAKTATAAAIITAETLKDAVDTANGKYPRETARIYPLVTMDNPETITEMAQFTLASVENWERRNNYAVLNPQNRNKWDKEDYTSIAALAIVETLTATPAATMYEVKSAAFSAIRAYQQRQDRNSEREYNPGWTVCNVQPRFPRPMCPALDRLITHAIDETAPDLSPAQMEVFTMFYDDEMSVADIAAATGKARQNVYKNLAKAYYWVLLKAVSIDTNYKTFIAAGYTPEDVNETLATMRKRGGMNKDQK